LGKSEPLVLDVSLRFRRSWETQPDVHQNSKHESSAIDRTVDEPIRAPVAYAAWG
jgi:hypothetical protein